MEQIYASNNLEHLSEVLADNIRGSDAPVFSRTVLITPSEGMNAWLRTTLARKNRVFAHFQFLNQDGFLSEVHRVLFNERAPNNPDALRFSLFECLGREEFREQFPEVAAYYEGDPGKRIQLAARMADQFDQYQLYRPEMIRGWENGRESTENPSEPWQRWLWNALAIGSRGTVRKKILDRITDDPGVLKDTFPEISLFGITIYTRFHLELFRALAKHIDVHFYLCLPSDHKKARNELLAGYGSKALELAGMFEPFTYTGVEPGNNTMLNRLQGGILHDDSGEETEEDGTIQVNSCYTPAREAECLYNYLLDLFSSDPSLKPEEVMVMVTDLQLYAPYIKAVFRNAPVKIPFRVSGASADTEDSVVAAIRQVLEMSEDELTSEKVMGLLEQNRIRRRFRVEDTACLRSAVREANIRFGRSNRLEDHSHYVGWRYGLDKMILGIAMLTEEEYRVNEEITLFPFRDAEAGKSHDLLRLKAFVDSLERLFDAREEPRTLAEWKIFLLEEVVEGMIFHDDFDRDDREEISHIYRTLSYMDSLEIKDRVSFSVFMDELESRLFTGTREYHLQSGRVTVSAPVPARGIPHRVICFLGLNNDLFPGKDRFTGFDLLGEEYLAGDRSKKETDKYLFLDTLVAARERLYLSYTGRNVHDNTEIPPSVVIDTLLDHLKPVKILEEHPLHGFSAAYQAGHPRLFTYLYPDTGRAYETQEREETYPAEESVRSFVKFFEHPMEWYFRNILGIDYSEEEDTLPETEAFELDHLAEWKVKNQLLRVQEEELEEYLDAGMKEGSLPPGSAGIVLVEELKEKVEPVRSRFLELTEGKDEVSVAIDQTVDGVRITGNLEGVFDRTCIAFAFSESLYHRVRAYVRSLLLYAEGAIDSAIFIGPLGTETSYPYLTSEGARSCLKDLMEYFKKGTRAPLKFTPGAATPPKQGELTRKKILESFHKDAGLNERKTPPAPNNRYMAVLKEEGYLDTLSDEEFEDFRGLAGLLQLNQQIA